MNPVEEVVSKIEASVAILPTEQLRPLDAIGRRLAEEIRADSDIPEFPRSAMDGYLVRIDDQLEPRQVIAECPPGDGAMDVPEPGMAVRIFTGSAVPQDDNVAVLAQEDVTVNGQTILPSLLPDREWIRPPGSHARAGDVLLSMNSMVTPGAIGLIASLGRTAVAVRARPRVAHVVTGRELVEPGGALGSGQIYDSNSSLVEALVTDAGAQLVFQRRVDEAPESLTSALGAAPPADLVLVSGGASVGDHDHTADGLETLGFNLHVRKVNVRPGRPLLFATRGGVAAFGLPGNPLSHFVCFHLFVRPALERMTGGTCPPDVEARLSGPVHLVKTRRPTWWPCEWGIDGGHCIARPLPWRDSSDLTCLATANGLVHVPAGEGPIDGTARLRPCGRVGR